MHQAGLGMGVGRDSVCLGLVRVRRGSFHSQQGRWGGWGRSGCGEGEGLGCQPELLLGHGPAALPSSPPHAPTSPEGQC